MPIGQTVAEICPFFIFFFKMAAVRYIGSVLRDFGPPTKSIYDGLCNLQNLVGFSAVVSIAG